MKKNGMSRKMIATIIITLMIAIMIGTMAFSVVSKVIVAEVLENANFVFDGIYGGNLARVNDLVRHLPEYEWLKIYSEVAEYDLVTIPIWLFFSFIGIDLLSWAEKED